MSDGDHQLTVPKYVVIVVFVLTYILNTVRFGLYSKYVVFIIHDELRDFITLMAIIWDLIRTVYKISKRFPLCTAIPYNLARGCGHRQWSRTLVM